MPRGDKSAINLFGFPDVRIEEQRKIGWILKTLDDKIALNRKLNETLEGMARALFQSWFVDFDPVKAKLAATRHGRDPEKACMAALSGKLRIPPGKPKKDKLDAQLPNAKALDTAIATLDTLTKDQRQTLAQTASHFPTNFQESNLGLIPERWILGNLSDIVILTGGGTPKKSVPSYWGGDIPWFSVKDAPSKSDVFVLDTELKITEHGLSKSSTKLLPEGTTIISARGTVGRLALTGYPMAMNQSCYGVVGAKGIPSFFTFFNLKHAIDVLRQNTHGAVFDTITRSTFETVDQIVPLNESIECFERAVKPLLGRIKNNCLESRTLVNLRDSLLPKILSGELLIPNAEKLETPL